MYYQYTDKYIFLISHSILQKLADNELAANNIEQAVKLYSEIIEADCTHEIVFANLALAQLKNRDFQKSIEYCNKVLEIIKGFRSLTRPESQPGRSWIEFRSFMVKILLRKCKAQEALEYSHDAFDTVQQILVHEPRNAEAKKLETRLKVALTRKEIEITKEEASNLIKAKNYNLALEKYNECLKKIHSADLVSLLAIILNKCACHLFLNQFDDIISLCVRGLNLITNHRHKVIQYTDKAEKKGKYS